ncbi:Vegetative incompatibility protein HET-E-1 [Fusarium odoratissimum]|uniref:GPI inositol-deacylase n=1 Tax=Fusarium oxysporum f. sp. cubense (strain race 4) TaxID=2502994 RepID=N1RJY5_FUSC4|nr:Vegetative incompatibility protein HET-E-1 [Fusarium odoratissimum]
MFFRKQRRSKPDLHPSNSTSSRDSTKGLRSLFPLSKSQSKTSTTLDEQLKVDKGPIGLNLLYCPTEPEIDLIFVHGLGGNSRKTWSKSFADQSHFWPEDWLSQDPAFRNVRIHSYGYDWYYLKGKEDCLNVHHIGKSLLGAISIAPCIANSKTYIIIIGHSMGGLVMKKAYILAKQDAEHKALAGRFAAFYFLATPHRGANSAKMLKNLLKIAYDRAYVGDLEPNSEAVQVINDEFRHFSADLELWSFYETENMKYFSSLIVDPESAVLGYRGEKQIPMTADHRSICKFDTPQDSNYLLLRDSLASTVSKITTAIPEKRHETIKSLRNYLQVSDMLDDDLENVCESRMHGSCEWISNKDNYIKWRDGEEGDGRTLWIKGRPATGKSVLAGYVVDQLRESGQACSYFFFKHGDRSKAYLGRCLRRLAFQMAALNAEASDTILKMQADGISFDGVDERTLWRILFLSGIFRVPMARQYWVIDALDECSNPLVLLKAILPTMDESIPLRILVTSRDTVELDQGFAAIPPNMVQILPVSIMDTQSDLRLLIESRSQALAIARPQDRSALAETILDKSRGSFLWTILVIEELQRCHSRKEIHQILEDVPRGMKSLYKRTLDYMSQVSRGKELAKTILVWAACAVRPMTIGELDGALTLDIHDSFPNLEESIATLCGQLVIVDKQGRVNMVHETAREFLVSGGLESEFSIDVTQAHTRMAETGSDLMATCGNKTTKIWDIRTGQVVHSLVSPPRPLSMEFDGDMLVIASRNNCMDTWILGHNVQPDHGMLAVAYNGQPIILWDMEEDTYAGNCGKKLSSGETSTHVVVALAFNLNPDIGLLAVAYLDGDLALLDPYTDRQLECFRANCQTLAPSPNGRFLAAGCANGIIHVYEFDTFKLLYRVKSSNSYIKQLAFSKDSMLLADIRGSQCTVWKPEALLRESLSDDSSGLTSATLIETVSLEAKAKVTCMAVHHKSTVIFCGKDDGIQKSTDKGWLTDPVVLFKTRLDSEKAITDVSIGEAAAKFLVSTRESDHLFDLNDGKRVDDSSKLMFLNQSCWICSVDLSASGLEITQREDESSIAVFEHFFIPHDWFAGKKDIVCTLAKGDVALTRGGDLAVIRGGVEYNEAAFRTVVWTAT